MLRSRLAPTPSGFLHLGNAVNFVITWLLVRRAGGRLALRIDDADCTRSRSEYVEDIFRQLEWLGLDWDEGPQGPDDFAQNFSQQRKIGRYQDFLLELAGRAPLYSCHCSRSRIRAKSPSGLYPGLCRDQAFQLGSGLAVRVWVPEDARVQVEGRELTLFKVMGDFILWRKDGLPAYQLASLVDDIDLGSNLIVRGSDLLASTAAQLFLAELHGNNRFGKTRFYHHPLIAGADGRKLSKSDGALSLKALREAGQGPSLVYTEVARLFAVKHLPEPISLCDLLAEPIPPFLTSIVSGASCRST